MLSGEIAIIIMLFVQMFIWLYMNYMDDPCMWMHTCMYIQVHMCVCKEYVNVCM